MAGRCTSEATGTRMLVALRAQTCVHSPHLAHLPGFPLTAYVDRMGCSWMLYLNGDGFLNKGALRHAPAGSQVLCCCPCPCCCCCCCCLTGSPACSVKT